jgi:hypothetical protein
MPVTYSELNQTSTAPIKLERVGAKFQAIWKQSDDAQVRKVLESLKIKTSREQACLAGDWNFESIDLRNCDCIFWVITLKSAEKLLASGFAAMNILLD